MAQPGRRVTAPATGQWPPPLRPRAPGGAGATITTVTDTLVTTDHSKLASVDFTSSTDVTGKTVSMTLKSGATVVGSPYSCTLGAFATTMTITCATGDNPLLNAFDTTGLTVL